jgi:hypothetical protein
MLHWEEHRLACLDRLQRLRREADAKHLALQLRGQRQRRRRRLALAAGLDRLLRARRQAAGRGAGA